jgi:hypothetical protein
MHDDQETDSPETTKSPKKTTDKDSERGDVTSTIPGTGSSTHGDETGDRRGGGKANPRGQ